MVTKEFLVSDSSQARISAIRTLVEINKNMAELVTVQDLRDRVRKLEQT